MRRYRARRRRCRSGLADPRGRRRQRRGSSGSERRPARRRTRSCRSSSRVPLVIRGDPIRLRQALDNLIVNAIAYSPSKSEVVVGASVDETNVLIVGSQCGRRHRRRASRSDLRSGRASRDLSPRERARAGGREVDRGGSWRIAHGASPRLATRRDVHDRAAAAALWLAGDDGVDRCRSRTRRPRTSCSETSKLARASSMSTPAVVAIRTGSRPRDLVDLDVARLFDGDVARRSRRAAPR